MERRKRIALILHYLDEQYQISVFNAASQEARSQDADLICIQGSNFSQSEKLDLEKQIFQISRFTSIDGFLILTSAVSSRKDNNFLADLPGQLREIPCVSLGHAVQGMDSITITNRKPMELLMEHLIVDHGYRRFLFVGGSSQHQDSAMREAVFTQAINRNRRQFSGLEGAVIYGSFFEETAFRQVRDYIEAAPQRHLDAIIAANDNMALGALKALRLQNDPAWANCAVTGFDDTPQAATEIPALTSVHQPLDEMGRLGIQLILDKIHGRHCKKIHRIESTLVIRNSCGCSAGLYGEPGNDQDRIMQLNRRIARIQRQNLEHERRLSLVNALGQAMTAAMDFYDIVQELKNFLHNLGVRTFFLILYETELKSLRDFQAPVRLMYARQDEEDRLYGRQGIPMSFDDFMQTHATRDSGPSTLTVHHLASGQEILGMLVYDVEVWDHPFMCSISAHIANSIKRVRVLEDQARRARQLESEVDIRTRDLRHINALLEKEIRQRTAMEQELRRSRKNLDSILAAMPVPVIVYRREDGIILYTNTAFADLASLSTREGRCIGDYLDIPEPCEGLELAFQLGDDLRDDIPVLIHTASMIYDDRDCLVAGLVDLRRQKTLEEDVLRISEYERRRFGLDLHDDICQRLAGIAMYSKVIAGMLDDPSSPGARSLEELSVMVGETLHQTRMYAHASFPVDLQNLGLHGVLGELCDQVAAQTGKPCVYASNLGPESALFRPEQEINIYRIIQEAVQNAVKHARASRIEVALEARDGQCLVRISDDGNTGFAAAGDGSAQDFGDSAGLPAAVSGKAGNFRPGMGMRSMSYRASQLGGKLRFESRAGGGCSVCLTIPLPR